MLVWKEINGLNENMSYAANIENGVELPTLNEEVLFCRSRYNNSAKDLYFTGYIYEGTDGLTILNFSLDEIESVVNGIKWAYFNKPETKNNIGYGIAYIDENGNNFVQDVPNIIDVHENEISLKINELKEKGCSKITVFKYIKPCSFAYNWDYVEKHIVNLN